MKNVLSTKRGIALAVTLLAAVVCVLFRLLPNEFRLYNLTPFGALFLFVGARLNWKNGWLLPLGIFALTDWYFLEFRGWQPVGSVYLCYAMYLVLARSIIGSSNTPVRITGTAILASTLFFLITNFQSWTMHALDYPMTFSGLMQTYAAGIPFHNGILGGDLVFGGLFFGFAYLVEKIMLPRTVPSMEISR
jgi:hypothetical protein